jgi:DNA replication and repair protein RecF
LIALKLAQYSYLQQSKGFSPLLLLDDIFDKLDDKRVRKLMEMVSQETFGQIFVSDTHPERIKRIFEEISAEIKVFVVENGAVAHA